MGKRGPAPKPTALRVLEGNPGKRPLNDREPKPKRERVECPPELSPGARAEWDRIIDELDRLGLITTLDRAALAAYCQHWGYFVTANQNLQKYGDVLKSPNGCVIVSPYVGIMNRASEMMYRYAKEFGFTPSSRTQVSAGKTPEELAEEEEIFGRRLG